MANDQNGSGNTAGRALLPNDFVPTHRDILLGRRSGDKSTFTNSNHAGNQRYKEIMRNAVQKIKSGNSIGPIEMVAIGVVQELYSTNGEIFPYGVGFIRMDKKSGQWYRLTVDESHKRIIDHLQRAVNQTAQSVSLSPSSSSSSLVDSTVGVVSDSTNRTDQQKSNGITVKNEPSTSLNGSTNAIIPSLGTSSSAPSIPDGGIGIVSTPGTQFSVQLPQQQQQQQPQMIIGSPNTNKTSFQRSPSSASRTSQSSMDPLAQKRQEILMQQQQLLMELNSNRIGKMPGSNSTDMGMPNINVNLGMNANNNLAGANLNNNNVMSMMLNANTGIMNMNMINQSLNASSHSQQRSIGGMNNMGNNLNFEMQKRLSMQSNNSASVLSNNSTSMGMNNGPLNQSNNPPTGMPAAFAALPPMDATAASLPPSPQKQQTKIQQPVIMPPQMNTLPAMNILKPTVNANPVIPTAQLPVTPQILIQTQIPQSNAIAQPNFPPNAQFDPSWAPSPRRTVVAMNAIPNRDKRIVFVKFSAENEPEDNQGSPSDEEDDESYYWPAMLFQNHDEFLAYRGFEMTVKNTVALSLRLSAVKKAAKRNEPILIAELFGRTNDYVFAVRESCYRHSEKGLPNAFSYASQRPPPKGFELQTRFLEFCKGLDAALVVMCPDAKAQNWHARALEAYEKIKESDDDGSDDDDKKPSHKRKGRGTKRKRAAPKKREPWSEESSIDEEDNRVSKVSVKKAPPRKRQSKQKPFSSNDEEGSSEEEPEPVKPRRVSARATRASARSARLDIIQAENEKKRKAKLAAIKKEESSDEEEEQEPEKSPKVKDESNSEEAGENIVETDAKGDAGSGSNVDESETENAQSGTKPDAPGTKARAKSSRPGAASARPTRASSRSRRRSSNASDDDEEEEKSVDGHESEENESENKNGEKSSDGNEEKPSGCDDEKKAEDGSAELSQTRPSRSRSRR